MDEQYQRIPWGGNENPQGVLELLVDSEIVLSARYGKTRVFINKNLINRDS